MNSSDCKVIIDASPSSLTFTVYFSDTNLWMCRCDKDTTRDTVISLFAQTLTYLRSLHVKYLFLIGSAWAESFMLAFACTHPSLVV